MEPLTGFEPALSAWKADVLPLHHNGIKIASIVSDTGYLIQLSPGILCGYAFPYGQFPGGTYNVMRDGQFLGSSL